MEDIKSWIPLREKNVYYIYPARFPANSQKQLYVHSYKARFP